MICWEELSSSDNCNEVIMDKSEIVNTEDCNFDHNVMSFSSQIGRKKVCVKEKNNQVEEIYKVKESLQNVSYIEKVIDNDFQDYNLDINLALIVELLLIRSEVTSPDGKRSSFNAVLQVFCMNCLLNLILDTDFICQFLPFSLQIFLLFQLFHHSLKFH